MEDANHEFDSMGDTKQLAVVKEDPFLESFVFRPVDDEWFNSLENFTKLNECMFWVPSSDHKLFLSTVCVGEGRTRCKPQFFSNSSAANNNIIIHHPGSLERFLGFFHTINLCLEIAARFSIASTYGNHPKGHLIKTIADLLQSPQPDAGSSPFALLFRRYPPTTITKLRFVIEVLLILLKGARICSRDEVLLDPFYERAFIQRIMQFAGLLPSLSPSPVTENIEVLIEARKSLVNILAKSSKAAHQAFLDLDGPQSCMAAIQVRVGDFLFPTVKVS
jgi:hypothetical protein